MQAQNRPEKAAGLLEKLLHDVFRAASLRSFHRAPIFSTGAFSRTRVEGVSRSTGRLVHKGPDNRPETGIWVCSEGRWRLSIPRDELCYFVAGRATYRSTPARRSRSRPARW